MTSTIIAVVVASLGSSGLFALIQFLIQRKDKKADRLGKIEDRLNKLELDSTRTQLLILMADYPNEKRKLLSLAEFYFEDLGGDWYMSDIFCSYLKDNQMEIPTWFKEKK